MATNPAPEMKKSLGVTGLTMNAMALIAPGAFLWLTFYGQASTGATAPSMWIGIVVALLLCLATAICYAEMAKLYPGTGSSYYFAEQSFLNHHGAWRYARLSKFIVGWGSHLYYWIYPGVMVGTMGIVCGYLVGTLRPDIMSASNPGPVFMMLIAAVFSFLIAYIAHRGISGATSVNVVINFIQITALIVFSVMALGYRINHPPGTVAWQFDSTKGEAYSYEFRHRSSNCRRRDDRHHRPGRLRRAASQSWTTPARWSRTTSVIPTTDDKGNFLTHPNAVSVVSIHNVAWAFIQATVAILILVGFESVTAMGGEARNPKRDVPIAVITSLLVQGAFCYLIEYFCANYFLNSGYTMQSATGSAAPIGDMMIVVGDALFGQGNGRTFMLFEAATVILALIGTTLSCMNTGARVTYAMGKDNELAGHLGRLHSQKPHSASRYLDARHHLSDSRLCHGRGCLWRHQCPHRRDDPGAASRPLFERRLLQPRHSRRATEHLPDGHPRFKFRHLCPLYVELHHLHGGVSSPSEVQSSPAPLYPALWTPRQPRLHGLLSDWSVYGLRR